METKETKAFELFFQLRRDHIELHNWSMEINNRAKLRAGCCKSRSRTIEVTRWYMDQASWTEVEDTILHEVGHVLVGTHNGHNRRWVEACQSIGLKNPTRKCQVNSVPPYKYGIICPDCRMIIQRLYRRPRKNTGTRIRHIGCSTLFYKADSIVVL